MKIRVGLGYDVHQLSQGIPLILGGIKIDADHGIVAHSDGDIVCHSLIDALLGAANLGDIGELFPDNLSKNMNRSSLEMLSIVWKKIQEEGYEWGNADIVIALEQPKLGKYKIQIKEKIAHTLNLAIEDVSIKATTEEGLGYIGNLKGIASRAVVLISKN